MEQQVVLTGLQTYFENIVEHTKQPKSVIEKRENYTKIYNGANLPFMNNILNLSLDDPNIEATLDELEEERQNLDIPITIWADHDIPALNERGYQSPGKNFGMILDVNKARLTPSSTEVKIIQVENEKLVEQFVNIFVSVFGFTVEKEFFLTLFKEILHSKTPPWINYLALINEMPVGCSSLTISRNNSGELLGGFYNAAVIKEARGQGVATAMALERIKNASEMGIDHISIILMADAMARGYCEKIGFRDCCEITPYLIQ